MAFKFAIPPDSLSTIIIRNETEYCESSNSSCSNVEKSDSMDIYIKRFEVDIRNARYKCFSF